MTLPQPLASWTRQVTAVLEALVTVAEKVAVPPAATVLVVGLIATDTAGGALTVTVAVALLVPSCTLVATTWQVAAAAGAV